MAEEVKSQRSDRQTARVVQSTTSLSIDYGYKSARCPHTQVQVSQRERTLMCLQCKQPVDPITFILEWATDVRHIENQIEIWKAMHEDRAGQKFDDRFKENQQYIRVRPVDRMQADAWDLFAEYFGKREFAMTARRKAPGWFYGHVNKDESGRYMTALSLEYVRSELLKREEKKAKKAISSGAL